MLKRQVIKLYRDILHSIKKIPDKDSQKELRQWARQDFEKNKHHTEEVIINIIIMILYRLGYGGNLKEYIYTYTYILLNYPIYTHTI